MTLLVPKRAATAGSSGKMRPGRPCSSAQITLPVRSHTLMCTIEPSTSRLRSTSLSRDIWVASPVRTPSFTSGAPTPRAKAAPRTRASLSAVSSARFLAITKLANPTASSTRRLPAAKRYKAPRTAVLGRRRPADSSVGADTDQSVAHRDDNRLELRVRAELGQQALHVAPAGVQRDTELAGDDIGLQAGRQHAEHIALTMREGRQRLGPDLPTHERLEQPRVDDEAAVARSSQRVQHLRE